MLILDSRLRRLLVRFRGKVEFDYTDSDDICRIHVRRDDASEDDWLYVSFVNKGDNHVSAISELERRLMMEPAEFKQSYTATRD